MYKHECKQKSKFSVSKHSGQPECYYFKKASYGFLKCFDKIIKIKFLKIIRITGTIAFLTVSLIGFSIALSKFERANSPRDLRCYDNLIWPIVMQDPEPFDENHPPGADTIIKAAVWEACSLKKTDSLNFRDKEGLLLTKQEVEEAAEKLFGENINFNALKPRSFGFYNYNRETDEFLVEPVSDMSAFVPNTLSARCEKGNVILNVGYVIPKNQFSEDMKSVTQNKAEKIMKYTLKKNRLTEGFYVASVEQHSH